MKIELKGTIIRIGETQTFSGGFQKREFVVQIPGERNNDLPLEAAKEKCEVLDKYKAGDQVEVKAYLNGSYWDKGDRYFLSLRMAYIKRADGAEGQGEDPAAADRSGEGGDEGSPF